MWACLRVHLRNTRQTHTWYSTMILGSILLLCFQQDVRVVRARVCTPLFFRENFSFSLLLGKTREEDKVALKEGTTRKMKCIVSPSGTYRSRWVLLVYRWRGGTLASCTQGGVRAQPANIRKKRKQKSGALLLCTVVSMCPVCTATILRKRTKSETEGWTTTPAE